MEEAEDDLTPPGCSRNKRLGEQRTPAERNEDQVEESHFLNILSLYLYLYFYLHFSIFPLLDPYPEMVSVFSGEKETTAEEPGSPVKSAPASPAQSPVKSETKSPVVSPSKSLGGESVEQQDLHGRRAGMHFTGTCLPTGVASLPGKLSPLPFLGNLK